jgi:hypothetical protein
MALQPGNEQGLIEGFLIGPYRVAIKKLFGTLYVVFSQDAEDADRSWQAFRRRAKEEPENDMNINPAVLADYHEYAQDILQQIAEALVDLNTEGQSPRSTVYVGHGLGGCMATLLATVSPPREVWLYNTPFFSNWNVSSAILQTSHDRAKRAEKGGYPVPPITAIHSYQDVNSRYSRTLRDDYEQPTYIGYNWRDIFGNWHQYPSNRRRFWNELFSIPRG